jgi:hypothetical protein
MEGEQQEKYYLQIRPVQFVGGSTHNVTILQQHLRHKMCNGYTSTATNMPSRIRKCYFLHYTYLMVIPTSLDFMALVCERSLCNVKRRLVRRDFKRFFTPGILLCVIKVLLCFVNCLHNIHRRCINYHQLTVLFPKTSSTIHQHSQTQLPVHTTKYYIPAGRNVLHIPRTTRECIITIHAPTERYRTTQSYAPYITHRNYTITTYK